MAKSFRRVDRAQAFLLPPDMTDWLPADHLVWFVIETVEGLDLSGFLARRQLGGVGRAAYDPAMMVSLLIYAYSVGQRSSRQIERLCRVDVAFRIACAQDVPDHVTIARFRAEHEQEIGDLFTQILTVCARAGMGRLGTVALDGTKIAANAALSANRRESRLRQIAVDIVGEAGQVDTDEDELVGDARGDELPEELADPQRRRARIRQILAELDAERAAKAAGSEKLQRADRRVERARDRVARTRAQVDTQNRARQAREAAAAAARTSIPGTRPVPVEQHSLVQSALERLARAEAAAADARHGTPPSPPGASGETKRNLTDPDSRIMKTRQGWIQGYNAQLVVSADYLILAANLTTDTNDIDSYQPMITLTQAAVEQINDTTDAGWKIGCVLADAGYASEANLTAAGPDRLIAVGQRRDLDHTPSTAPAHGDPPKNTTARAQMSHRLRTPEGAALYKHRAATVEPVNAHLKDRRTLRRFSRRGLTAARSELLLAAAVTNLLRIHTATS